MNYVSNIICILVGAGVMLVGLKITSRQNMYLESFGVQVNYGEANIIIGLIIATLGFAIAIMPIAYWVKDRSKRNR